MSTKPRAATLAHAPLSPPERSRAAMSRAAGTPGARHETAASQKRTPASNAIIASSRAPNGSASHATKPPAVDLEAASSATAVRVAAASADGLHGEDAAKAASTGNQASATRQLEPVETATATPAEPAASPQRSKVIVLEPFPADTGNSLGAPRVARSPSGPYWYYCQAPRGYYPYVRQCAIPWQRVPARLQASG